MKKKIVIVLVAVIILLGIGGVFYFNSNDVEENVDGNTTVENTSSDNMILQGSTEKITDLDSFITKVYLSIPEGTLPKFQTVQVDLTDEFSVTRDTGLTSTEGIEEIYKSEPMMSSQAYSLVVVKTKDAATAESIQQKMVDNVDPAKWVCVCAEKIYSISKDNIVVLVMSSDEWASPVFESVKKEMVNGKEISKTVEENTELPPETL